MLPTLAPDASERPVRRPKPEPITYTYRWWLLTRFNIVTGNRQPVRHLFLEPRSRSGGVKIFLQKNVAE